MKKICFFLVFVLMLNISCQVFAYEPVSEFWPVNTNYSNALNNKDFNNIIKYGLESMSIIEKDLSDPTVIEWYEARAENVGYAYERLGEFDKSADMYEIALPLAKMRGMTDSVKVMSAKIKHFRSKVDVYQETPETQSYFGAFNEPTKGVYYGLPSDSTVNISNKSGMLLYVDFGDYSSEGWMNKVLKEANQKGIVVEIALNVPNEGNDFKGLILERMDYVTYLADFLSQYNKVKYYIRFGAEMDIWSTRVNPDEFKQAFRKVSDIIHSKLKNAAMVFSPNMVSPWDVNVNDFYPGDDYVDWVGTSLYMTKYFLGTKNDINNKEAKDNEAVFGAGDYANPVVCLENIVALYGSKKPIMISESGASHFIRSYNENATNWAINKLKAIYSYLPMVYPQVKLIMHFDKVMPNEVNDYSLVQNSEIEDVYKELVKLPHFIQNTDKENVSTYKKLNSKIQVLGNKAELYSYSNVFGNKEYKVNYYINNKYVTCSNFIINDNNSEIPYKAVLDLSKFDFGKHKLKVVVEDNKTVYTEKEYELSIHPAVKVNNEEVIFDVPPAVINDRTMVPMRAIFEKLGASVGWDDKTQTVYATKDNIVLSLTIGEKSINVNGKNIEIDVPAMLVNGRTLVPLRAVSQSLGCNVSWAENEKCAYITGGSK